MANPNWYNRRKGKQQLEEDVYRVDASKRPEDSVTEILTGLYLRSPAEGATESPAARGRQGSDARRLSYLNALVTLLSKDETRGQLGYTTEELMLCVRASLVEESVQTRATALRVLRYLIRTEHDVTSFNALCLPYLVARSMDVMLRNEVERAQALRVVRRVVGAAAAGAGGALVSPALLRCLAAVARSGGAAGDATDRLCRPAVATLGEIGVVSPALLVACGGVAALTRFLQELATPRMAEALCGVLLHALDAPASRRAARVDLRCLCAPYCDFNFRPGWLDKNREEREKRFTCSRLSLLCVLRSWPGVLHFCHPLNSGLRALVHAGLHLQRLEVRKAILDLLYELLGLPQPEWTDEISVALAAVDPSDFQDSWRLNDGFVAEEGRAILPHLGATGPDVAEIHLALLLYCFLEAGLLEALAEVIVTSDTFISVRATVLLGQLLHLTHALLPPELCAGAPPLPALLAHAAAARPAALAALAALHRLHAVLDARPAPATLFLDHILHCCAGAYHRVAPLAAPPSPPPPPDDEPQGESQRHSLGSRGECARSPPPAAVREKSKSVSSRTSVVVSKVTKTSKLFNLFDRENDNLMRDSLVLQNKDGNTWNWEIIRTILKESGDGPPLQLSEGSRIVWTRRVLHYLRPSSNKYSHADTSGAWHGHEATRAGCQLVRVLLRDPAPEAQRLLEELFVDVTQQVEAILSARSAHECLFSPQHMCTTMCQMYFLFAGQLCHTHRGLSIFHDTGLYKSLVELCTTTHHSCYVKLVVSSLDYTLASHPRELLARTLACHVDASRLYCTRLCGVLLRAAHSAADVLRRRARPAPAVTTAPPAPTAPGDDDTMERWLLRMLVRQIRDESKAVVRCALAILDEACNVPRYKQHLVEMREAVRDNCGLSREPPAERSCAPGTAGDRGYLLWLSLEVAACAEPRHDAFLAAQLQYWTQSYNLRYVRLVDAETHEALTLACEAGEEAGGGVRRGGGAGRGRGGGRGGGCSVPPHLHAALAQHAAGRRHLADVLPHHHQCVVAGRCGSEQQTAELKASLWALGGAAAGGAALPGGADEGGALAAAVQLATHCDVYSVRAAALYALSLVGSTRAGADQLYQLGWLCVRHTRHDHFPIVLEEKWRARAEVGAAVWARPPASPPPSAGTASLRSEHSCGRRSASEGSDAPPPPPPPPPPLEGPGRLRHTSESSTSGVSSCDSTLGRYVFPDRFQTLSPIPSSSSLSAMKSSASRRRAADVPRRTSVTSYSAAEATSSPPSQQDLAGLAELKIFNSSRRPHLSESEAGGEAEVERGGVPGAEGRRARAFSSLRERSRAADERNTKLSLLKYDWKPMWCAEGADGAGGAGGGTVGARVEVTAPAAPPPAPRPQTDRYLGICLPANLIHIFPKLEEEECEATPTDLTIPGHAYPALTRGVSVVWEAEGARGAGWRHDEAGCLECARRPAHPTTYQLRRAFFTGEEAAKAEAAGAGAGAGDGATSPEVADEAAHLYSEILKHATRMGNPLWHKQAKPALLSLKQRHPEVFQSVCLYSDVSALLAAGTYVAPARRFLQELFLDARFECLAQHAARVPHVPRPPPHRPSP